MIKRMLVAFVMTLSLVLSITTVDVFTAPPAAAVAGCNSNVQDKADTWAMEVWYPGMMGRLDYRDIRLVGTVVYQWCPNGSDVNKIRPKWIQWCYNHIDNRSVVFDGVKFNAYYFDDNTDSNPPQIKVPDDGTVQNCKVQDIAYDQEAWLRMDQSPGWKVSSWVVLDGFPDQHWDFKWDGREYKYFHPSNDVVLKDWYS